jgi:RNA polymerase sigma-70 factor (ECF subfamily)
MTESPLIEPSDAILVARARNGNTESFGILYRRYADSIYRYIYVQLNDVNEAEDLTADVFFRSYQALGTYREKGRPFSAFLYQIARNVLIDHLRKQKPGIELSIPEPAQESLQPPDEHISRDEQIRDLRQAMDEIPLNYREVIILRIILAMPTANVANWLNMTEDATRVVLHRALTALRGRLREAI